MTPTQEMSHKSDQHDDKKAPAAARAPVLLIRISSAIDAISIGSGKAVALLIVPMVVSLVYEVICRYLFSAPTIWASDVSTILYGAFFMLGAAYTLQRQQHIRTDFLYEKWSTRTKGIVDSVLYIMLYFPGLGIFLWVGWQYAWRSVMFQERIVTSPWMPHIWPLKLTIPISTALLLIQGVSELLKSLYAAVTGLDLHGSTESIET
jgi:TRAP-type mannitol/chloroaromatic compound transport system permease small subunit